MPKLDLFSRRVIWAATGVRHRQCRLLDALAKDATAFVMSNRDLLADRPVWLFSSGPLGTDATDAKGVDLRTTAEPNEIPGFREAIHPGDHRVSSVRSIPTGSPSPRRRCESSRPLAR
jgi:hypothetical protein